MRVALAEILFIPAASMPARPSSAAAPSPALEAARAADTATNDPLLASFAPVVAPDTRILILGSLPGTASLAIRQYYGHPRNAFWKLVGDSIGVELAELDYPTRLSRLLEHHIGLWDVIATARRNGSLDSEIREPTQNDLLDLIGSLSELNTIAFNGSTAAKIGLKALGERVDDYRILLLPSSSPAHASLSYAQKLVSWLQLTGRGE
ncbi:DNA-deoxyinosine glycosylase [Herbaspirillum huttiense]|uniref:DNA-deoxyinosine glycosylase n=1 Tax=Herbaspirillum huttiense subsp. lycopersici TaxID=3074428 RepID=A0ABU2EHD8_9BURK|nr:DNA-deoxyinosine glycosylase [Herbaspirillum huttiense]MDR9847295.1 DNA-deoxyinosine glycosylase [Herbaspirillum huttiense SE1]